MSSASKSRPPTAQADPCSYGWRYVRVKGPDGKLTDERVPLTEEDLLFPRMGDDIEQDRRQPRRPPGRASGSSGRQGDGPAGRNPAAIGGSAPEGSRRHRSHGRHAPRRVGFEGIQEGDGGLGVRHGRVDDPGGHQRARRHHLVVRGVAQPAQGSKGQADPIEVGIGSIDQLEPGDRMHLIARRECETPAPQGTEHFVQRRVVRPPDAGPPAGFTRAGRQVTRYDE